MRFAVLGQGTRGDLYPLLGLARTLLARGHEVVVLEYDEYAEDVRTAGLPFHEVAQGSQCASVFANVPEGRATRRTEWATEQLYFEASLASALPFTRALAALPRPDVLLAPTMHLGAMLGADLLGLPLVPTFVGTSVPSRFDTRAPDGVRDREEARTQRLIDRVTRSRVAALRAGVGLPPAGASHARVDRLGGLVFAPAPLAGLLPGVPASFEIAGYPAYYGAEEHRLPGELLDFLTGEGPPVVVCSIGDGWARALPEPLRRLAEEAGRGRFRLLIVGGRMGGLAPGPGTRIAGQVNLVEVLGHADVSVNHGGMGTLVAALRNAVPSVLMSQWPDGRRNAALLDRQGLGVDVGSAPTAAEVLAAVDRAFTDPGIRRALGAAGDALRHDPEPADVLLARLGRAAESRVEGRNGRVPTSPGRGRAPR
ncbi:vancomycin aglycone glucosyltransferase [Crossiella equi]|uniref:Vancomycin aglycone glucosyltransferase n=1 Tax=Crossiella equi TaxID=130796 RepID=A0ABS5A5P7_9PSEU|nr:glycosyltransferase [Crossiella equi]MBP2471916.1 vancomycin aglycone glucosyltransferase [Crossiella equi]